MNDGQGDVLVELKKIREEMVSALSLSDSNDSYGMFKEFVAMQAEVKQMRADQEKQKIETMQMKEAHEKALEDQKAEYKKVCDELAELKEKQQNEKSAMEQKDREELKHRLNKMQNVLDEMHTHQVGSRRKSTVREKLVGNWILWDATNREEYEEIVDGFLTEHKKDSETYKVTFNTFLHHELSDRTFSGYQNGKSVVMTLGSRIIGLDSLEYTVSACDYAPRKGHYQKIKFSFDGDQLIIDAEVYNQYGDLLVTCKCTYVRY